VEKNINDSEDDEGSDNEENEELRAITFERELFGPEVLNQAREEATPVSLPSKRNSSQLNLSTNQKTKNAKPNNHSNRKGATEALTQMSSAFGTYVAANNQSRMLERLQHDTDRKFEMLQMQLQQQQQMMMMFMMGNRGFNNTSGDSDFPQNMRAPTLTPHINKGNTNNDR
jgi:hypothetical protein